MALELVRRNCRWLTLSRSTQRLPSCFSTIPEISRISSKNVLFDVNLFVLTPDIIRGHLQARRADKATTDSVTEIANLQKQRVEQIVAVNQMKQQRKVLSNLIGQHIKKKEEDQVDHLRKSAEALRIQIADQDKVICELDTEIATHIAQIPNLLDDRVPDGNSEEENQIVYEWGTEMRKLGDNHLWHDEIGKRLGGLIDQDLSTRLSGSRFYVLIGPLARLERALSQYFLDFHTIQRGYTEVSLPFIVSKSVLQGTGQIPKFEEDLFKVNHKIHNEDSYLIPTAEVPLTNLYRGELLEERSSTSRPSSLPCLPMKLVSCTPCFRAEAGSHGRDTRGLMRVHQFQKVELVKICKAEDSEKEYDAMCRDVESLLKSLELPHRKALLCSGDTGFSASLCYDYEVWMPGQQTYREVSSCSNCKDFQSRRMKLRHRLAEPIDGKTISYPHTMNGSGLAVGRILIAIIENNYRPDDGIVVIPSVLRPYMGGMEAIAVHAEVPQPIIDPPRPEH